MEAHIMSALKYTEAMLSQAEFTLRAGNSLKAFAQEKECNYTELSRQLARRRRERKERGECF